MVLVRFPGRLVSVWPKVRSPGRLASVWPWVRGSRMAGLGLALGVWYGKASSGVVIGTGSLRAGGVLFIVGVFEHRPVLGVILELLRAAGGLLSF